MSLAVRAEAELELRKRRKKGRGKPSPYEAFRARYWNDPAGFVTQCLRWEAGKHPYSYQLAALGEVTRHPRLSIRSPHGAGKSALLSWLVLWFALTRDGEDWKIPITASAWRQLTHYLGPEIHKWARRVKWELVGRGPFDPRTELQTLNLRLSTGEAFTMASDNSELIEGAHAVHLLYIFDESKAIPDPTWDSAEGAFSTGGGMWVAVSTPGEAQGRFYSIQARRPGFEDWHVVHITAEDCILSGAMDREWMEGRRKLWGEESAVFQNRVLGEFATASEDGVIPLAWIERANERYLEWQEGGSILLPSTFTAVGVDVGRGGDKTVLALRFDWLLSELRRSGKADTMETAGAVAGVLRLYGGRAVVDVIGIGAGVFDRLREQEFTVYPFNAGAKTTRTDLSGELLFVNLRSAAWWNMRELLDPANGIPIALPPDDLLTGDLSAPKWKVQSGGRIAVESKPDIYLRLHRSTDDGDAAVMAYWDDWSSTWEDVSELGHVEGYKNPWQ